MQSHDGRVRARRRSRRALLAAAGAAIGLASAGCLGSGDRVRVLSAGSLAVVFEETVGPAFATDREIRYEGEYHGTNAVMGMIEEGTKRPDVVIGADVDLLRDRLYSDHATWDVEFAATDVGIAYDLGTPAGKRLADGDPWYEVLREAEDGDVAISDPDLDPLGYRAIHLFDLAEREHDLDGFRAEMADRAYREPDESALLAGIEAGDRACAIAYRNMAAAHDVSFLELPDRYNFAAPEYAETYARASYTTESGHTVRGSPVVYNATVRTDADAPEAGRAFVRYLLENPSLLRAGGLRVPDALPREHGSLPEGISP